MALFCTAAKHIAKSSGSATLHPVPDLNSAERFRPMCLVKRRKSFWPWKKHKMIPTQITLDNLFEKTLDVPKPKKSTLLEKDFETPTVKLDALICAKLATKLDLSLHGSDTVNLTIKLGNIQKSEMGWEIIQESLQKQLINQTHVLLQEVKKSKRTTLCVVLESISTSAEGDLKEDDDASIKTDDTGDVHKSVINVDVGTKGEAESKTVHSFSIPPGTVLAYSCNEFSINDQGYASLHSAVDRYDSTDEGLFSKAEPKLQPTQVVEREYKSLTSYQYFDVLRTEFKKLLLTANDDVFSSMHLLLCAAEFKLENKEEDKSVKASTFAKLFQDGGIDKFKVILEHLGFMIPEDWKDSDAVVKFPEADVNLLKSIISLLDELQDMDMGVRTLLSNVSVDHMKVMSAIVMNEIKTKENLLKTPEFQAMFTREPSTRLLLKNAGFVEMRVDDDDVLCFTKSKHFDLVELYSIFYVFSY